MHAVIPQATSVILEQQSLQESYLEQPTWSNMILTTALVALGAIALSFAAMLLTGMYTISTPWVFTAAVSSSLLTGFATLFYAYCAITGSNESSSTYSVTEDAAQSEESLTYVDSDTYSPRSSTTNPSITSNHSAAFSGSDGNEVLSPNENRQTAPLAKPPISSYTPPTPASSIAGVWKGRDLFSTHPRSLIAIYEHEGVHYGRMLLIYDDAGRVKDTILQKKEKSTVVHGNPPYCGMDIAYSLKKLGSSTNPSYSGEIIDPVGGTIYYVDIRRSGNNLIVRPKLWFFGIDITWDKAHLSDLPQGFSIKEIKDFVPSIPKLH